MTPHETIKFTLNEPQILKLADPTGDLLGPNVIYPTSDGRTLSLPRHVAIKLNALWPEPNEEISICRYQRTDREPAEWSVALTPKAEQVRAKKEADAVAYNEAANRVQNFRAAQQGQNAVSVLKPHCEGRKAAGTPPKRVSYKTALREITHAVTGILKEAGEQWSDAAKQDYCSTAFIAAAKTGQIVFDFMEEGEPEPPESESAAPEPA